MATKPLRARIAALLDSPHPLARLGRAIESALAILIALNVIAVVLESLPSLEIRYQQWFAAFEALSVAIFTVEYIARTWVAVENINPKYHHPLWGRIRYLVSPLAVVDLFAILPFYLALWGHYDFRILRILRLLRVFKFTRYSVAMQALFRALREELDALLAAFFVLFVLLLLAASGIYLLERDAQPEAFGSIPASMWWAVATLTTVGYGDVIPITGWGKLFGGFVTLIGVGMVALPAGIIASGYASHLKRQRVDYNAVIAVLSDRNANAPSKRQAAAVLQSALGLSDRCSAQLLEVCTRCARGERIEEEDGD